MNRLQRVVLGGALAVLLVWAAVFAPYKSWRADTFAFPPPRHSLFWPASDVNQKLDAERALAEVLFICVLGGGVVLLVGGRRPKDVK